MRKRREKKERKKKWKRVPGVRGSGVSSARDLATSRENSYRVTRHPFECLLLEDLSVIVFAGIIGNSIESPCL